MKKPHKKTHKSDLLYIVPCSYEDIAHYKSKASKEQVSISPTQHTQWYKIVYEGNDAGVAALMFLKGGGSGARMKGLFIEKRFRGMGIGEAVIDYRINECEKRMEPYIEAFSLHSEFYINKKGFRRLGVISSGAVKIRRLL